jgi:adenylosuccinate lyase
MVSEHERDARAWKTEWVILPEACMAFAAAAGMGARMLAGLEVDAPRMAANITAHGGYLQSEPVMRALADRIGKHAAHEVVYQASMTGIDAGQNFRSALRADPRLDPISDAELSRLLDVRGALGPVGAFVDRVVRSCTPVVTG